MPRKSNPTDTHTAGPGHNSLDRAKLKNLVERIESIEAERAELASDIKDVYAEAAGAGFDTKALRQIIKLRKQDKSERDERQALIDTYLYALGDLADLPLGRAAIERAGLMPPV